MGCGLHPHLINFTAIPVSTAWVVASIHTLSTSLLPVSTGLWPPSTPCQPHCYQYPLGCGLHPHLVYFTATSIHWVMASIHTLSTSLLYQYPLGCGLHPHLVNFTATSIHWVMASIHTLLTSLLPVSTGLWPPSTPCQLHCYQYPLDYGLHPHLINFTATSIHWVVASIHTLSTSLLAVSTAWVVASISMF